MTSAIDLLEETAKKYPNEVYIREVEKEITFDAFRDKARSVGTALLLLDLGRKPVIIQMEKGIDAIVAMFGCMYAGCPYAPVATDAPKARLDKIRETLNEGYSITAENFESLLNTPVDEELLRKSASAISGDDPQYIIFTSGSTGIPKGVSIRYSSIVAHANWINDTFHYGPGDILASQAPIYFDVSTFDIFGSLRCGATMLVVPHVLLMFPSKLPEFLKDQGVTSIFWVPTVLVNIANSHAFEGIELPSLKYVMFAGEVMPCTALNLLRKAIPDAVFVNMYGPTEATDVCTYFFVNREFSDEDSLPIGEACENAKVWIINDEGKESKVGEQGEICVTGSGVALGYWNAPELTDKAFIKSPIEKGVRMYKTGDLGYVNELGEIMFLGRKDGQVKVKGNRIELGEIEAAAHCVEGIDNATAVFDKDKGEIVLFLKTKEDLVLRKFNMKLKAYIPNYMLPSRIICMEDFPVNANGKIDRVKLQNMI